MNGKRKQVQIRAKIRLMHQWPFGSNHIQQSVNDSKRTIVSHANAMAKGSKSSGFCKKKQQKEARPSTNGAVTSSHVTRCVVYSQLQWFRVVYC
jgi:hypothetical protein